MPLANLMVDRLHAAGVLDRGAAYWYGRALQLGATSPLDAVERLTALPLGEAGAAAAGGRGQAARRGARRGPRGGRRAEAPRSQQRDALQGGVADAAAAAQVRHRRHRQHLRRRRPGAGRGAGGRRHHRGHPLDRAVAARLRARTAPPPRATAAPTPRRRTSGSCARRSTTSRSELGRYIQLTNYSSGPVHGGDRLLRGVERLDMLLNDAMYGILFRDINMRRTFIDQYFSRRICALAGIIINTGEDNYLTTADAVDAAHTVLACQFINEALRQARRPAGLAAGPRPRLRDRSRARRTRSCSSCRRRCWCAAASPTRRSSTCRRPSTRETDIFFRHAYDVMFDLVGVWTRQGIQLLGMMTEAMHTPLLADRYVALKAAAYIHRAARGIDEEFTVREDGKIANRARVVFGKAMKLLEECQRDGMVAAIGKGRFGDVKRAETGGKGLDGVIEKAPDYFNPFLEMLEAQP